MLANGAFSAASRSELAAVIATRVQHGGRSKDAKKLIRQALSQPNENTLAQAVWLSPRLNLDPAETQIALPNQHEADARLFHSVQQFDLAVEASKRWQSFQPFSSSPALFGSFIASVFTEDHQSALELVELALPASICDYVLHNNRAFSLAQLGRLEEAESACEQAAALALESGHQAVVRATEGLIQYRKGETTTGRRYYREAVQVFRSMADSRLANLGLYFWAKEELRLADGIVGTEVELVKAIESLQDDKHEWRELQERLFGSAEND